MPHRRPCVAPTPCHSLCGPLNAPRQFPFYTRFARRRGTWRPPVTAPEQTQRQTAIALTVSGSILYKIERRPITWSAHQPLWRKKIYAMGKLISHFVRPYVEKCLVISAFGIPKFIRARVDKKNPMNPINSANRHLPDKFFSDNSACGQLLNRVDNSV